MLEHFPHPGRVDMSTIRRSIKTAEEFDDWRLEGGVFEWLEEAALTLQNHVSTNSRTNVQYLNATRYDSMHIERETELLRIIAGLESYLHGFAIRNYYYVGNDDELLMPDALNTTYFSYERLQKIAITLEQTIEQQRKRFKATMNALDAVDPPKSPIGSISSRLVGEGILLLITRTGSAISLCINSAAIGYEYAQYRSQCKERNAVQKHCTTQLQKLQQ